jgi:hypothetical protein
MKSKALLYTLCLGTLIICSSWGFFAHKRINRLAVFNLPKGIANFYRANIDYICEHSTDPDKRRYVDSMEGSRHFFNADHYGKHPFDRMPQRWKEAERQYSADTLDKYGVVPWAIQYNYYRLVKSFKEKDTSGILKASVNLAHYIADAHVPLHMTTNHNGQLTHQEGIHGLWETRLPELFSDSYRYKLRKAHYVSDPLKEAWAIARHTFKCVDSVLLFEAKINSTFPPDQKYTMTKRGTRNVKDYSVAYATAYSNSLHGMVERQMRAAMAEVSSYWFSAWVDAGQPDLDKLIDPKATVATTPQQLSQELSLFKLGKVLPSN